jgi:hypothetical protein
MKGDNRRGNVDVRHCEERSDDRTQALISCPGRSASRCGALLIRDPKTRSVGKVGPGSAVHRFTLHRVQDTFATNETAV